jgi:Mlc titration factor MtfA (ptsG expression regulator)
MLPWLKQRRRREVLADPFPPAWLDYLRHNVLDYATLTESEQAKLRDDLRIFIVEKNWEGCGGLAITDEIRVTIAAQACFLILALDLDYLPSVWTILVYPGTFGVPVDDSSKTIAEIDEWTPTVGQAMYRGPVVLAWDSVLAGGRDQDEGRNTVYHEFAHQLDFLDGAFNGTPLLEDAEQSKRWHETLQSEYDHLVRAVDRGRRTLLEDDAATNEGEFFAVATEYFFGRPAALAERRPRLYELLRDYYRQDPAQRRQSKGGV